MKNGITVCSCRMDSLSAEEFDELVDGFMKHLSYLSEKGLGVVVSFMSYAEEGGSGGGDGVHVRSYIAKSPELLAAGMKNIYELILRIDEEMGLSLDESEKH
ncbi:MAG: hypothetical protein QXT73_06935 [Candidatus Methanomethylicaceae archaeon]